MSNSPSTLRSCANEKGKPDFRSYKYKPGATKVVSESVTKIDNSSKVAEPLTDSSKVEAMET